MAAVLWSGSVQAATIVLADGCFLRDATTVYLTEPTCQLTLENNQLTDETVTVQLLNLDPDGVDFTGATTTITTRTKNTLAADIVVPVGTTAYTIAPWYSVGDDFYFVALSDNQARGTVETNPIFEEVFAQVAAINPIFFTNSGDLVQGSDSLEVLNDMFTAVQQTVSEASVPMYPIPGNHDYDTGLATYSDFFGSPNYSYDVGPVHFIGLSTSGSSSKGVVTSDQLAWLQTEFEQTTQPYSIIYFHHPLSVPSWGKPECCFADTTNRDDVAAFLDQQQVDFVINGHSQGYDYRWLTPLDIVTLQLGFYQLITGGAGGNIAEPHGQHHFILAHVTAQGITHQVINESDFGLAVEYDNNNGRHGRAQATIENSSAVDIPYVRLKFRLDTSANNFLIQDETGQYYPQFQSHSYGDYTVVYVEVSLPANTTHTFTAVPATVIHNNLTHTIDPTGIITYNTLPTSTTTATDLKALPESSSTTISDVTTTAAALAWTEIPSSPTLVTTYTFANLAPNAFVQIGVNGQIVQRLLADRNGQIRFRYQGDDPERHFVLRFLSEPQQNLVTLPANHGTAQVRLFTSSGQVLGQWDAFDGATVTDPKLWRANIIGETDDEVIVYEPSHSPDNLRLYSLAGSELQRATINTSSVSPPWVGEITGDAAAELLYLLPRQSILIVESFDPDVAHPGREELTLPASLSTKSSIVAITDVTQDGVAEVILFDQQQRRLVALSYVVDGLQIVRSYRINVAGTVQAVAAGYFQPADQLSIAVLYQQNSGRQSLWYLVPHGTRAWKRQFGQTYPTSTIDAVLTAAPRRNQTDRLVVTTVTGQMMTYRAGQSRWQKEGSVMLDSLAGTSATTTDEHWQLGLINGGSTWPMRLITSELAAPGRVMVWQYHAGKKQLTQRTSWYGYGDTFTGGTIFAGND